MTKIIKFNVSKKITLSLIFILSSVILPQIFHIFGAAGTVFLPMHIPVLLAGVFLDPMYSLVIGAVSPMISTYLTGMPAEFPVMPIMALELATYGLVMGLLCKYTKLNIILKLAITMITGRVSYAIGYFVIQQIYMPEIPKSLSIISASLKGIPGIIIQFVVIILVTKLLSKRLKYNEK